MKHQLNLLRTSMKLQLDFLIGDCLGWVMWKSLSRLAWDFRMSILNPIADSSQAFQEFDGKANAAMHTEQASRSGVGLFIVYHLVFLQFLVKFFDSLIYIFFCLCSGADEFSAVED